MKIQTIYVNMLAMTKVEHYYKTSGNVSPLDSLSFKELITIDLTKVFNRDDNTQVLQSIHNYYAKKLKIPTVRVIKTDDMDSFGTFEVVSSKDKEENVFIYIDDFLEWTHGVFSSISTIIHETKHAHQAYLYEKFKVQGCVPTSDFEKLLLLFRVFYDNGCGCDGLTYYSCPEELDAFIFEFKQINKLMTKYDFIQNKEMVLLRKEFVFKLLSQLKYNKEGLDNLQLRRTYKILKRNLYCALKGDYGKQVFQDVIKITANNFDLKRAFEFIVKELDLLHDEILLDNIQSKEMGINLNIQKNGFIDYSSKSIKWYNREKSNYHLFIDKEISFDKYEEFSNLI